jgi:hypothetical protein
MSGPPALLYPILAQVLLTLVLLFWTGRARVAALRAGRARIPEVALSAEPWPDDVRKISNNYHNQFETPVLFYVLCGAATYLGATGFFMVLLAWGYIASRLVHSWIHVTTNRLRHRFLAFATGALILAVMWVVVAVRLAPATL